MKQIVAAKTRTHPTKPFLGYVMPFVDENNQQRPVPSNPLEFRNNNEVFVFGDYQNIDRFQPGEFFRLLCRENDKNFESGVDQNSSTYCAYVADGRDAFPLDINEYFQVIDGEVDLDNRYISIPYKPERRVFLRSEVDGDFYGPFDYELSGFEEDNTSYKIRLKACSGLKGFELSRDVVYRFKASAFATVKSLRETILLANLQDLSTSEHTVIDYIADEQLLKWGNELLSPDERLIKRDLNLYRNLISELSQTDKNLDGNRKIRLISLIDRLEFWTSSRSDIIADYLKTDAGILQLDRFIDSNKEELINAAKKSFQVELDQAKKVLENQIGSLRADKDRIEQEVSQTKEELNSKQKDELTHELQSLINAIEAKKSELRESEEALSIASIRLSVITKIDDLKKEREYLDRRNEDFRKDNRQLEETRDKIIQEIRVGQDELRSKLRELKPYIDILNGVIPDIDSRDSTVVFQPAKREDKPESAALLIEEIRRRLATCGREYRFEHIANYVLSIHQNFLTVFAGPPGVGKTSVVTYLADSLGLRSQRQLLTIPIARGMTSQRDLLGFYNPLSQRFQPAPTGLYEALKLNMTKGISSFPLWVLLDEANLSPMEHYFSAFMGMCDGYVEKTIDTGEPGNKGRWQLSESLRFIATINYDNTTEPLSRRMIDRVPVIRIDAPDSNEVDTDVLPNAQEILSFEDMCELFPFPQNVDFTDDENRVFSSISDSLRLTTQENRGPSVVISPRKRAVIQRFCCMGRNLMRGLDGSGASLRALDYGIAQHVLPLINGNGEKYRSRLNDLLVAVEPLDLSTSILKRILEVGKEEYLFYRFFC